MDWLDQGIGALTEKIVDLERIVSSCPAAGGELTQAPMRATPPVTSQVCRGGRNAAEPFVLSGVQN